jgi:acyl carrier protein
MEPLKASLIDIFEVDDLDTSKKFTDLDEWDSLSSLSVIAILDSDYGITLSNADLINFKDISEFIAYVETNKR